MKDLPPQTPQLDHLVVMASSLAQGAAWCESTLGVTPGPGGEHPLMGTHNRLLTMGSTTFPATYLEIIAINPEASNAQLTRAKRWFDMDDGALQAAVRHEGPRLVHWVARVPDIAAATAALSLQGVDCGRIIEASRETPQGPLHWQITVRDDGRRLFDGCLPTLIEWRGDHPTRHMAPPDHQHTRPPGHALAMVALEIQHPQATALQSCLTAVGLHAVRPSEGAPCLRATLSGPKGPVQLTSI